MSATGGGSVPGTFSGLEIFYLVVVILVAVFLVPAIVYFAISRPLRKLKAERTDDARSILGGRSIVFLEPAASFFGQDSLGMSQMRGTGCLAFTPDEILFLMWVPKREFRVPVASIQRIETPRSHLGKSKFRPLLKVTFADRGGAEDSMAWLVGNLSQAKAELEKIARLGG
jgi:hypothetical protein